MRNFLNGVTASLFVFVCAVIYVANAENLSSNTANVVLLLGGLNLILAFILKALGRLDRG
jgi:hypothetical protein